MALHHRETPVVQTILQPIGGQRRGDPVGRPLDALQAGCAICAIWDTHEDAILDAILDTHESLRGFGVGCCHRKQPTGKFGPENIHKPRGNARTSHPPAKPRPRIRRQGSTTNPDGKEANCGAGNTRSSVAGKVSACPQISGCFARGCTPIS